MVRTGVWRAFACLTSSDDASLVVVSHHVLHFARIRRQIHFSILKRRGTFHDRIVGYQQDSDIEMLLFQAEVGFQVAGSMGKNQYPHYDLRHHMSSHIDSPRVALLVYCFQARRTPRSVHAQASRDR